jgi:small subunit ribosomal protein S1
MDMDALAALMDGSIANAAKIGDRVQGIITKRGKERCLVDCGAKSEAVIETLQIGEAQVGDTIDAYVISNHDGELFLSTAASGEAADRILADAMENGTPMEGTVTGRNAGGFDVRLGDMRAFCPVSQIDRAAAADLDTYIGQTLSFLVMESKGKDVVVSRRKLLDKLRSEGFDAFWASVNVGDSFEGTVTNIQAFGVFVDIGGAEGMVHRSELGYGNSDPSSLNRGDKLTVRILELREETGKISLSAKDPANSPWKQAVGSTFKEGGTYTGVVQGVEAYGAFVELSPGLQGLLHSSRTGGTMPKKGDSIEVRLDRIDHERQRLELSNPNHTAAASSTVIEGEEVEGTVEDVLKNGVVVKLTDGRTGWWPERNAALAAGTVLAQRFRRGRAVKAKVVEQQPDGRRVVLTQKTEAGNSNWRGQKQATAGGFGTLGDLLGKWNKGK